MEGSAELSRREQEVLDSLLENLANKEIGSKLNISERTVKFHVSNLLSKFGVRRRADLILLCYQKRGAKPPHEGPVPKSAPDRDWQLSAPDRRVYMRGRKSCFSQRCTTGVNNHGRRATYQCRRIASRSISKARNSKSG